MTFVFSSLVILLQWEEAKPVLWHISRNKQYFGVQYVHCIAFIDLFGNRCEFLVFQLIILRNDVFYNKTGFRFWHTNTLASGL